MAPLENVDRDLLNDFVTESTELIESIDQDLVRLEGQPADLELLNNIFRALHTIKGSASFLGLDLLTHVAHAAEDALNVLRRGQIGVSAEIMDHLLRAADVIRTQIVELAEGNLVTEAESSLIEFLRQVGSESAGSKPILKVIPGTASDKQASPEVPGNEVIELSESKRDLIPFMVDDLNHSLEELAEYVLQIESENLRPQATARIADLAQELERSADFFSLPVLKDEVACLVVLGERLPGLDGPNLHQVLPRVRLLLEVMRHRGMELRNLRHLSISTATLRERLVLAAAGSELDSVAFLPEDVTLEQVAKADQVEMPTAVLTHESSAESSPNSRETASADSSARPGGSGPKGAASSASSAGAEQTIRVDVGRLESLLNLVGELVLQKNRVLALSRQVAATSRSHEVTEAINQVASDLDRVTGDLQMSVMKTRLQPLNKVFSRFPRVIRDLARATGKEIQLEIVGGDTEVDKSVIEALGDPLVHILRNSADHGVEMPGDRQAAGKSALGTIWLTAEHQGNHVLVRVRDDGRGIDPHKLAKRACEKGVVTEEEVAAMATPAMLRLIFKPGFSTAEKVSDLSGRGVGMDVVLTNIQKLNGSVDVDSELGRGTTISMRIPLTVAIMPAMTVAIGRENYAIPLSNILEIVKPEPSEISTISGQPVLRLREEVLPMIDLSKLFACGPEHGPCPFAVVVELAEEKFALLVHRLIGQQEVVIKPLDDLFDRSGMVSGATVREDGGVSLIMDINGLMRSITQGGSLAAA